MVYLHTHREVIANTHPKTGIVLSDELLDMSQTIMTAIRTTRLQAELTNRNRHIIADNQQTTLVDVLLIQPVTNRITTQIHKSRGLEEKHLTTFETRLADKTVTLVLKRNIGRLRKSVQYHESRIVAGHIVLITDIAQTYNQIFVHANSY